MCLCVFVCVYVCLCVYAYALARLCVCMCARVRTRICVSARLCVRVQVSILSNALQSVGRNDLCAQLKLHRRHCPRASVGGGIL